MRTDPRKACDNPEESLFWAIIHDVFAHALLGLTLYSRASVRFHDWTSIKAWPKTKRARDRRYPGPVKEFSLWRLGYPYVIETQEVAEGIWEVFHPSADHSIRVKANSYIDALQKVGPWFVELAEEFGGIFDYTRWTA